jgi:hypothetical protein
LVTCRGLFDFYNVPVTYRSVGPATERRDIIFFSIPFGPPLSSSGQSSWLQIQRFRVRFPSLPDFLRHSGSGTVSIQPREDN